MRKLILSLAIAAPAFAQADIIKCYFTEPFITTTYSMVQQKLTWIDNVTNRSKVMRNVSFQIKGAGQFELWDANRNVIQSMALDFTGSDGMSDRVYPYDVQWNTKSLRGGCESNFLKATQN